MSIGKDLKATIKISEHSKLVAAIITGILAVFVAMNMGAFFDPEVISGKVQLFLSCLCVASVGITELISLRWEGKYANFMQKWVAIVAFLLMPIATLCMMEFLNGTFIYNWSPLTFIQNYLFMLLIYLLAFAIFGKLKWALMFSHTLSLIFGLANHYVLAFRGTPFLPVDIASAKTGMTVAGGYDFSPDNQVVLAVTLFVLLMVLSRRIRIDEKSNKRVKLTIRIAGLLATLSFCGVLYQTDWFADHGIKPDFFNQTRGYANRGSMFQFVINTKYLKVQEPDNYSAEETSDIVAEIVPGTDPNGQPAAPAEQRPNIICVMNETLSDMNIVGDFTTNEDFMPFMHSLEENTIKGFVHVPVYGAGTANSEFEFLTGNSVSFLPTGACAYESYIKGAQPSLMSSLNVLGYYGIAFHPYYGENWSRNEVYPNLGFQEFMDLSTILNEDIVEEYREDKDFDKFQAAAEALYPDRQVLLRRYISDSFDYYKVIEAYERVRAQGDQPFFMFNVTMQNHSGYTSKYGNFEETIHLTGPQEGLYPKADQYLSLMKASDDAIQELIGYYSEIDEPTIICMFGDHQGSIEPEFYEDLLGKPKEQLSIEEEQKMYITPFLIWANYDIEEDYIEDISVNYLSTLVLQTAGLPMTSYQQYLAELYKTLPIITTVGYMDKDGNWYRADDTSSPYIDLIEDYRKVQYNNLLDRGHRVENLFMLQPMA